MRILPSQMVQAIESLIGRQDSDIYSRRLTHPYLADVNAILALLDDVPTELITLSFSDYVELNKCRSLLAATTSKWTLGDIAPARDVNGKDPVERIRRLMQQCQDRLPPPEPELPFIDNSDRRAGIESQMHAAWRNFETQTWLGAKTFAAAALEAILLWVLETKVPPKSLKKRPNDMVLFDLVEGTKGAALITDETATLAHMARDARNLIHPGKVARSGVECSKASALTAFAGLYRVVEDLKRRIP